MGSWGAIMMDMARKVRLWAPSYAAPTGECVRVSMYVCVCVCVCVCVRVEEGREQGGMSSEEQSATPVITHYRGER